MARTTTSPNPFAPARPRLPDVVITDMHMPDMDGVSLAKAAWSAVPLVLLTSGFMPPGQDVAQLFAARLLKPIRQKQLFDTVARCIAAQGGSQAVAHAPQAAGVDASGKSLTAGAASEDRDRCMEAGMNDYLTKPLYVAALTLVLERWMDQPGVGGSATAVDTAPAVTAVQDAEPALMDFEQLAQFKEFDDDALTMTREVMALFRTDAVLRLAAIGEAIRSDDAQALSWASHALVGAAGNVGAVAMQSVGMALETHAKTGVVSVNAAQQLERLHGYWKRPAPFSITGCERACLSCRRGPERPRGSRHWLKALPWS